MSWRCATIAASLVVISGVAQTYAANASCCTSNDNTNSKVSRRRVRREGCAIDFTVSLYPEPASLRIDVHQTADQSLAVRKRSALLITDTEDKLMAAAAMTGLSSTPNTGYKTPAATGMPSPL